MFNKKIKKLLVCAFMLSILLPNATSLVSVNSDLGIDVNTDMPISPK